MLTAKWRKEEWEKADVNMGKNGLAEAGLQANLQKKCIKN